MKVSEIMVTDVVTLSPEDSVARALNLMANKSINQILIVDENGKYLGMIFAKQIINSTAQPSSKLKSYIVNTSTLSRDDDVEKASPASNWKWKSRHGSGGRKRQTCRHCQ